MSQELFPADVKKVLDWAIKQHSNYNLLYDGQPYSVHLTLVTCIGYKLRRFLKNYNDNILMACACHDILEDCGLSYNDLVKETNREVADIVYCVTNELGKNRQERNSKTYPKIKENELALYVKLCDRLANTIYSTLSFSRMTEVYAKELPSFRQALYTTGVYDEIWEMLEKVPTSLDFLKNYEY